MTYVNDLIGLKRAWNARPGDGSGCIDCCVMVAEVRHRLGYHNFLPDIQYFFDRYTDATFPPQGIARWLLKNATRIKEPELHALVLLPGENAGAMGIVLEQGVLYISSGSGVVVANLPKDIGHYFRLHK
jgi:hypothetical protein